MKKLVLIILLFIAACSPVEMSTESSGDAPEAIDLFEQDEGSLLSENRIVNIAHRGASGHAPEHTLAAYQTGEAFAADYIEIDLQMTKDGRLVAMHDAELDRTTEGTGEISDYSLDELKILEAGTWFNEDKPNLAEPVFAQQSIPTIEDILETFGHEANYYIEIKNSRNSSEMVEELVYTLNEYELTGNDVPEGKVIIQSFSEESLREIHTLEPSLPLIQLLKYEKTAKIKDGELANMKEYAIGVGVNYQSITKSFVEKINAADLLIHVYTVNEKEEMEELIEWGVTGIFTDYPDRLQEIIAAR